MFFMFFHVWKKEKRKENCVENGSAVRMPEYQVSTQRNSGRNSDTRRGPRKFSRRPARIWLKSSFTASLASGEGPETIIRTTFWLKMLSN
jgi:hypothetical protein